MIRRVQGFRCPGAQRFVRIGVRARRGGLGLRAAAKIETKSDAGSKSQSQ